MRKKKPTVLVCVGPFLWLLAAGRPAAGGLSLQPEEIDRALHRGCTYLAKAVGEGAEVPAFGYPLGARALYAAALLSAGADLSSPALDALFSSMARLPFQKIYSVSLFALAYECKYRHLAERFSRPLSSVRMSATDRSAVLRALSYLQGAQGPACGGWSYFPLRRGARFDLSNTQFAVLGLEAGRRLGLTVSADVARRFVGACLSLKEHEEGQRALKVSFQYNWLNPKGGIRVAQIRGRPCGWRYSPASTRPSFAMTAATVGNLFVARKILRKLPQEATRSIEGGLLYLDTHWDLLTKRHAKPGRLLTNNYYYTVWTVEKAFDLGQIAFLGDRNWYEEEALYLLRSQNADGSWGGEPIQPVATSFALLFLARAQAQEPCLSHAPYIVTGAKGNHDRDLVYLPSLGGSVSARRFLRFLARSPSEKVLSVAEKILRRYSAVYRGDLVGPLSQLLGNRNRSVRGFAKRHLRSITRLPSLTARAVTWWKEVYAQSVEAEKRRSPGDLVRCLSGLRNPVLCQRILTLCDSFGNSEVAQKLIEHFDEVPPALRERLHRTLCFLTGQRVSYRENSVRQFWRRYKEKSSPERGD